MLVATLGACSSAKTKTASDAPTVTVSAPADGAVITGNVVSLEMTVSGLEIVKADGDTSGKTGHFHIFIDREPPAAGQTIPKEPGIVHSAKNPTVLEGLHPGKHTLAVVIGNGTHQRIGDAISRLTITVAGPSIDASAPKAAKVGEIVTLTVALFGVKLVKAAGAPAGATGHLHVFIDKDLPAAGQAIPKAPGIIHTTATAIKLPPLTAGEHTIEVVLGDGKHLPFDPPVRDKVVITVE